jgi:hypothetical protein
MATITVAKRLVFHVGGYDPITPAANTMSAANPIAEMSLPTESSPVVRLVEFSRTLEQHVIYRRIRLKFYRIYG